MAGELDDTISDGQLGHLATHDRLALLHNGFLKPDGTPYTAADFIVNDPALLASGRALAEERTPIPFENVQSVTPTRISDLDLLVVTNGRPALLEFYCVLVSSANPTPQGNIRFDMLDLSSGTPVVIGTSTFTSAQAQTNTTTGTGTVPSGATVSAAIPHLFGATPAGVLLQPTSQPSLSGLAGPLWPSAIGATTFVANGTTAAGGALTGTQSFRWWAFGVAAARIFPSFVFPVYLDPAQYPAGTYTFGIQFSTSGASVWLVLSSGGALGGIFGIKSPQQDMRLRYVEQ